MNVETQYPFDYTFDPDYQFPAPALLPTTNLYATPAWMMPTTTTHSNSLELDLFAGIPTYPPPLCATTMEEEVNVYPSSTEEVKIYPPPTYTYSPPPLVQMMAQTPTPVATPMMYTMGIPSNPMSFAPPQGTTTTCTLVPSPVQPTPPAAPPPSPVTPNTATTTPTTHSKSPRNAQQQAKLKPLFTTAPLPPRPPMKKEPIPVTPSSLVLASSSPISPASSFSSFSTTGSSPRKRGKARSDGGIRTIPTPSEMLLQQQRRSSLQGSPNRFHPYTRPSTQTPSPPPSVPLTPSPTSSFYASSPTPSTFSLAVASLPPSSPSPTESDFLDTEIDHHSDERERDIDYTSLPPSTSSCRAHYIALLESHISYLHDQFPRAKLLIPAFMHACQNATRGLNLNGIRTLFAWVEDKEKRVDERYEEVARKLRAARERAAARNAMYAHH